MPDAMRDCLEHIRHARDAMVAHTIRWASINSGSHNLPGLERMIHQLSEDFSCLGGMQQHVHLPPYNVIDEKGKPQQRMLGAALSIRKRPEAPLQIFLGGHMDTVFAADHPFQQVNKLSDRLHGPGVADLKGGLAVMLTALQAFEQTPYASAIGWEILINPDEEIGSPGSDVLFKDIAARNHLGLIYEPALPDGTLAGARKGSGNFSLVVHGRAAHAGRAIDEGRNAIIMAAELVLELKALHGFLPGVTINPARIDGGAPNNIVPDIAVVRFNIRTEDHAQQQQILQRLEEIAHACNRKQGFHVELHGGFGRPAKALSQANQQLFEHLRQCGNILGIPIEWKATGGCCDGNNLAAYGLANVDSLGVRGGEIHSDKEYALMDSFVERASLTALFLTQLARGDITWQTAK